ncbi:MAG: hypothetical protein R3D00_14360 [Bacteroidia bacterium]
MDDNQLDRFFRDNIGEWEETRFDESAWEAIVPAIQTLTPRPAWFRFWGNWLGAGGAVILLTLLGGMGYLLYVQNQQLESINTKLAAFESGKVQPQILTDTLWCENIIRDTLWVPLAQVVDPRRYPYTSPPYSQAATSGFSPHTSPESPVAANVIPIELPDGSQHLLIPIADADSLPEPGAEMTVVFVAPKHESAGSDSISHEEVLSEAVAGNSANPIKKKLVMPDVTIRGIRVKSYIGTQGGLIKGGEAGAAVSGAIEGEFVLNPHWSLIVQTSVSGMSYEMAVNIRQPDFDDLVGMLPQLPSIDDLQKLHEVKMHGNWIMVPVSVKYTFLPDRHIQPYLRGGVLGYKVLNQDFMYELKDNGVEEKRFVSINQVPWTWNSFQGAVGGQMFFGKHWMGLAEITVSPGFSGQGIEKRRFHLVGTNLGVGYVIK